MTEQILCPICHKIPVLREDLRCTICHRAYLRKSNLKNPDEVIGSIKLITPKLYWDSKIEDFPENTIPNPYGSYFIAGTNYTGKTHLLYALVREALLVNEHPRVISAADFIGSLHEHFDNPKYTNTRIREAQTTLFLFIDDFCVEKETDWQFAIWYRILNERRNEQRHIVITTNTPNKIEERLFSRIMSMTTLLEMNEIFEG